MKNISISRMAALAAVLLSVSVAQAADTALNGGTSGSILAGPNDNVTVSNGSTVTGYISQGNTITISDSTVTGFVSTNAGSVEATNSTIGGDVVSNGSITLKNVVLGAGLGTFINGPGHSTISLDHTSVGSEFSLGSASDMLSATNSTIGGNLSLFGQGASADLANSLAGSSSMSGAGTSLSVVAGSKLGNVSMSGGTQSLSVAASQVGALTLGNASGISVSLSAGAAAASANIAAANTSMTLDASTIGAITGSTNALGAKLVVNNGSKVASVDMGSAPSVTLSVNSSTVSGNVALGSGSTLNLTKATLAGTNGMAAVNWTVSATDSTINGGLSLGVQSAATLSHTTVGGAFGVNISNSSATITNNSLVTGPISLSGMSSLSTQGSKFGAITVAGGHLSDSNSTMASVDQRAGGANSTLAFNATTVTGSTTVQSSGTFSSTNSSFVGGLTVSRPTTSSVGTEINSLSLVGGSARFVTVNSRYGGTVSMDGVAIAQSVLISNLNFLTGQTPYLTSIRGGSIGNALTTRGGNLTVEGTSIGADVMVGDAQHSLSMADATVGGSITIDGESSTMDLSCTAAGSILSSGNLQGVTLDEVTSGSYTSSGAGSTTSVSRSVINGATTIAGDSSTLTADEASFGTLTLVGSAGSMERSSVSGGITLTNSRLIMNNDAVTGGAVLTGQSKLDASGSSLVGTIVAPTGVVSLASSTRWDGDTLGIRALSIDSTSLWSMASTSSVDTLNLAGKVAFAHLGHSLNVGTLNGSGGSVELETAFGGDESSTDLLVVGSATGNTKLVITNAGGKGAQTNNGIRVVDLTESAHGAFSLLGDSIRVGLFDYSLSEGQDHDYYLTSSPVAETAVVATTVPTAQLITRAAMPSSNDRTDSGRQVWAKASGQNVQLDANRGLPSKMTANTLAGGADVLNYSHWRLGGYAYAGSAKNSADLGATKYDVRGGGVYADALYGGVWMTMTAQGTAVETNTALLREQLKAKGHDFLVSIEAGGTLGGIHVFGQLVGQSTSQGPASGETLHADYASLRGLTGEIGASGRIPGMPVWLYAAALNTWADDTRTSLGNGGGPVDVVGSLSGASAKVGANAEVGFAHGFTTRFRAEYQTGKINGWNFNVGVSKKW